MKRMNKTAFNCSKFISVGLLLTSAVLVLTAILIQIFEAFEEDLYIHLFTVAHIFTGLTFTILSVLHAKMHWKSMMIYIKTEGLVVSKEAIYAFSLTVIDILIGFLFVYIFLY